MSIRDLMTESMWGPETLVDNVTPLPSIPEPIKEALRLPEPIKEALATGAEVVGTVALGAFNDVAGAVLRGADSCAQSARTHIPGGFRAILYNVNGTPKPVEPLDDWVEVPDSKTSLNEPKVKIKLHSNEHESVPLLIAEAMTSC